MKRYVLLTFVLTMLASATEAQAASIFGRVIEVKSGDVITIFNLNRPVRVKLLGVDAPEMDQAFGDVAKKHLADLVYDKSVLVEYSGIAAGSLSGRVLLNNTDIGAQMIRDGAAWFDPNNQNRLSATDREVYQQSEKAARSERRGLWQAENPTAPWEFVKAEAIRRNPVRTLKSNFPELAAKPNRPKPELTNLTLMPTIVSSSTPPNEKSLFSERGIVWREWRPFRPDGENFSVVIPEDGRRMTGQITVGDRSVAMNSYLATNGLAMYQVTWVTSPSWEEGDKEAIRESMGNILKGMSDRIERLGNDFTCELEGEKNIFAPNGYVGLQFDLSSCRIPAKARAYTKTFGDQRQIYVAMVFSREQDGGLERFINSFKITGAPKTQTGSANR